jgi:hypothetical protein
MLSLNSKLKTIILVHLLSNFLIANKITEKFI